MSITYLKTLDEYQTAKSQTAVICFTAKWCGPCKKLAPIFERWSGEYSNISFYKVDTEEAGSIASAEEITGLPTLLFFKNGNLVKTQIGFDEKKCKTGLNEINKVSASKASAPLIVMLPNDTPVKPDKSSIDQVHQMLNSSSIAATMVDLCQHLRPQLVVKISELLSTHDAENISDLVMETIDLDDLKSSIRINIKDNMTKLSTYEFKNTIDTIIKDKMVASIKVLIGQLIAEIDSIDSSDSCKSVDPINVEYDTSSGTDWEASDDEGKPLQPVVIGESLL